VRDRCSSERRGGGKCLTFDLVDRSRLAGHWAVNRAGGRGQKNVDTSQVGCESTTRQRAFPTRRICARRPFVVGVVVGGGGGARSAPPMQLDAAVADYATTVPCRLLCKQRGRARRNRQRPAGCSSKLATGRSRCRSRLLLVRPSLVLRLRPVLNAVVSV